MAGLPAVRRFGLLALGFALVLGVGSPTRAFEYFDGRLQIHGFFESQLRAMARDYDLTDDLDLTQWYQVLNVEVEFEVAPDGWGPFDLISTFARVEGRYDCVWTRGCGMLRSANSFGNRTKHLPKRLIDAQREGFTGTVNDIDFRPFSGVPVQTGSETDFFGPGVPTKPGRSTAPPLPVTGGTSLGADFFPDGYLNKSQLSRVFAVVPEPNHPLDAQRRTDFSHNRRPVDFFGIPGIQTLFGARGPDTFFGTGDEPAPFMFSPFENCIFALRSIKGQGAGRWRQIMGPWNPKCKIQNLGSMRNKPNPFNSLDQNPVLTAFGDPVFGPAGSTNQIGVGLTLGGDLIEGSGDEPRSSVGSTALPFKPPPENPVGVLAPDHESQGIFLPNRAVRRLIRKGEFGDFDQNFRQAELEWNRGASQQDEKELKEVYADLEMFDSRLWLRAGKQNIVWGKTELFRTTDQFNPQDLALATLPSLEESRIGLWALRGVWSFYELGPLEDVRLELAFNYDQFEPVDLGRCGEPYTPNPVCNKTFGLFAHGFAGLGAAGEIRPPDPWNSFKGIEMGARVEWRWGRFSFQLADFYGYNDFPWSEQVFTYERNVDPLTGRPRRAGSRGGCDAGADGIPGTGDAGEDISGCLGVITDQAKAGGTANWFVDRNTYDLGPDRNLGTPDDMFTAGVPDGLPDRVFEMIQICAAVPTAPGCDQIDPALTPAICNGSGPPPGGTEPPECDEIVVPTAHSADVVVNNPVNQQLYAMICSTSIGFSPTLDPAVCAQSVLNSPNKVQDFFRVTRIVGGLLVANPIVSGAVTTGLTAGWVLPLTPVNLDANDDPDGLAAGGLTNSQTGLPPSISAVLTDQQEALLGCGPFYGTQCDDDGPDLLNAEASAVIQAWPGYDGTTGNWRLDGVDTDGDGLPDVAQANPATANFVGGAPCLRFERGTIYILPGCRGPDYNAGTLSAQLGAGRSVVGTYNPDIDGCSRPLTAAEKAQLPAGTLENCDGATPLVIPTVDLDGFGALYDPSSPFGPNTGQQFWSELGAVSWNALMAFVALSTIPNSVVNATGAPPGSGDDDADRPPLFDEFDIFNSPSGPGLAPQPGPDRMLATADDPIDPATGLPEWQVKGALRLNGCSLLLPQYCSNISSIFSVIGHQRNSIRAGGNGKFGRQDWVWHGGSPVALRYERRNVLGFSLDFAEDVTKSNWGAELTWIEGLRFTNNNESDGISKASTYNLTLSVDRPTFINFLNPNRTIFFNSQWFFQYVDGYAKGFTSNGPYNVLATFTILTGYSQDRLLPSVTFVYDFGSNSGGALPQVTYRFTENFSATVGGNLFWGRWEERDMPLAPSSLTNRVGRNAYKEFQENGLSVVRDREEIFLRIRYTF